MKLLLSSTEVKHTQYNKSCSVRWHITRCVEKQRQKEFKETTEGHRGRLCVREMELWDFGVQAKGDGSGQDCRFHTGRSH